MLFLSVVFSLPLLSLSHSCLSHICALCHTRDSLLRLCHVQLYSFFLHFILMLQLLALFIASDYTQKKTLLGQTWKTSSKCYGPETMCSDLL